MQKLLLENVLIGLGMMEIFPEPTKTLSRADHGRDDMIKMIDDKNGTIPTNQQYAIIIQIFKVLVPRHKTRTRGRQYIAIESGEAV